MFNPLDLPSQVPFHFPSDQQKDRTMNIHMKDGLFWKELKFCQDNVDFFRIIRDWEFVYLSFVKEKSYQKY